MMKLKFFWYLAEAYQEVVLMPIFSIVDPASELDQCLADFANDSGGGSYLDAIPWLNETVQEIRLIRSGGIESVDRSRDAWGAELSAQEAKVYSLYDESYNLILPLDDFEKALSAWTAFLQMSPDINRTVELEIGQ